MDYNNLNNVNQLIQQSVAKHDMFTRVAVKNPHDAFDFERNGMTLTSKEIDKILLNLANTQIENHFDSEIELPDAKEMVVYFWDLLVDIVNKHGITEFTLGERNADSSARSYNIIAFDPNLGKKDLHYLVRAMINLKVDRFSVVDKKEIDLRMMNAK